MVLIVFFKKFFWLYFERNKKFRKTTRLIRIKFVGKLCLIFMVKIKALEAIFSENVFLLKEGEIEMLRNKAIGDG